MANILVVRAVSMSLFWVTWVLFLVSFAGAYWIDTGRVHYGLWRYCTNTLGCAPMYYFYSAPFEHAAQAMMTIALIVSFSTIFLNIAWAMIPRRKLESGPTGVGLWSLITCAITGFFNLLGVGIFGGKYAYFTDRSDHLSWSWIIGVLSACFFLITSIVCLAVVLLFTNTTPQSHAPPPGATPQMSAVINNTPMTTTVPHTVLYPPNPWVEQNLTPAPPTWTPPDAVPVPERQEKIDPFPTSPNGHPNPGFDPYDSTDA